MITLQYNYSLETIDDVVKRFWETAREYRVITFSGEMGAGKTTFISKLCTYLNVEDAVSSPTYALVNEYVMYDKGAESVIFHIDWYRLSGEEEAFHAGMDDCLTQAKEGAARCFIEWPEKAAGLLERPYLSVHIGVTTPTDRVMTLIPMI